MATDGPPEEGPYRTPPRTTRPLALRRWVALGGVLALLGVLALWLSSGAEERGRPGVSQVPPTALGDVEVFPAPEEDLQVATPLGPLLVMDAPDALAVVSSFRGAKRLRRGESLGIRFNRPMVARHEVGRPALPSPLVLSPGVEGEVRWGSRSRVVFTPSADAFGTGVREVELTFRDGLASASGELLVDDEERTLVLDGAPRVLTYRSRGRVPEGAPLPLYFDAPVNLGDLRDEILAFESGGGQRSVPIRLSPASPQPEDAYRVDVSLGRSFEAGTSLGLALLPRYSAYPTSAPVTLGYQLAPRPHIEGIGCAEGAAYAGQCRYQERPGQIVDIGPELRLLSSERLAPLGAANVRVSPDVERLEVELAPHGPPEAKLITVRAEWAPDQAYEVRVEGLRTQHGEPVRGPGPLAVRSRGHDPRVEVATGLLTYELAADGVLPFATIHPALSDVVLRTVEEGRELTAVAAPTAFLRAAGELPSTPLGRLAPDARPNRWGPGELAWRADGPTGRMAVVGFRPRAEAHPDQGPVAFVQATDLGVTVRAQESGLTAWVTSIATGAPVQGAEVVVADAEGRREASGRTDPDGLARIELEGSPLDAPHALLVTHDGDRAAMVVDPRRALGVRGVASAAEEAVVASIFTDRGAYRPGESMHVALVLRELSGVEARAVRGEPVRLRLYGPSGSVPVEERTLTTGAFGTAAADLTLPAAADLGRYRLEVARDDEEDAEPLGAHEVRVAQFRQPTFRVDLSRIEGPVHAGDPVSIGARATYLFGAPVTRGRLSWSASRRGTAAYPERWRRYTFGRADDPAPSGVVAEQDIGLSGEGVVPLELAAALRGSARARFEVEVAVTDAAGHRQAARTSFVAYPAAQEVGLRTGRDWVEGGATLEPEAIVIDHGGEPVEGRPITVRILREGWHSWWAWSSHARRRGGGYRLRRDQERQEVHRCELVSAEDPVSCAFTPERPGTYLLEAVSTDDGGREAAASRRVYVAGPDEHPDRDPPGAPITLTPEHREALVGQTAEVAFENPFPRAQALLTVEREGVLHQERRELEAGGQVFGFELTEAMVPNVHVGVTLVRPRTGEPGESIDLDAPDLRFGHTELRVRPAASRLAVRLEAPEEARPGSEVEVVAQVRDAGGRPAANAEVTLWAVDEGTLRLTSYQVPEPLADLDRPRSVRLLWEDLRRSLVSRLQAPPMPRRGGDGREGGEMDPSSLDDRERFEPTPLWAPGLRTDGQGRVRATVELPARATEYRVMAVAVDRGRSSGGASTQLTATQPVVLRPTFPRALTAGDRFEAAAFVHNATDAELTTTVTFLFGEERARRPVTVPAGGEERVAAPFTAPAEGPVELSAISETPGGDRTGSRAEVPIHPNGRFVRREALGGAIGATDVTIALPEDTPVTGGRVELTVAAHPFVGVDATVDALEESPWAGPATLSAALRAMAAAARLDVLGDRDPGARDRAYRGRLLAARLLALRNGNCAFGAWSSADWDRPVETVRALEALAAADALDWVEDGEALTCVRDRVAALVEGNAFIQQLGTDRGQEEMATALRALAGAGAPQATAASQLHDQRPLLSPLALAELALALGPEDARTDTLVLRAIRIVTTDPDDPGTDPEIARFRDRSPRTLAAVLEAASRTEVGQARAGDIAERLLASQTGWASSPWGTSESAARVLASLAAYAELYRWPRGDRPAATLDGEALTAVTGTDLGARYVLPIPALLGEHRLRIAGADDGPVFFSLAGRWAVALGEVDEEARGARAALHRVLETPDGRPLEDGATVALGELLRVRLFLHTEEPAPPMVALRDPMPAGFEAVDEDLDTTPRASLHAVLGVSPEDEAVDARAHHALRTVSRISHRTFETGSSTFYFESLPTGLSEVTYAIRATTVGTFTVPPAQLEARDDPTFEARSAMGTLTVAARPPSAGPR